MVAATRNEAAELLRDYLDGGPTPDLNGKSELQTLDEALAAERHATVQRIRLGLSKVDDFDPYNAALVRFANVVYALLDEEASR